MLKDIELCGMGNALVDIMIEAPDSEIIELGLKKGEMKIVTASEQHLLLERYSHKKMHRCSGGSAANTIIAFAGLGGKAAYTTALGNDEMGGFYANEFHELGIRFNAPMIDGEQTGTCFVFITPDSERTMNSCLAAGDKYGKEHIDEESIKRAKWVYIEGYKFSNEKATEAIFNIVDIAKKNDTKIAVTFSDRFVTELFRGPLMKVVESADLVFCNESEAMSFTSENDIDAAFAALGRICPNVVMTVGSKGSRVLWEGKVYDIPPYPATPVDSTGAGDMFAGAFFYGIIHTGSPKIAGHLASKAAAAIVSQFGARMEKNLIEIRDTVLAEIKD